MIDVYEEIGFFSKEECDKILNFSKIYKTEEMVRPSDVDNIDFETNRLDSKLGNDLTGKKYGKFYYVWDVWNDENSNWMFDKLINWFSVTAKIELSGNKKHNCSLHKYIKGDSFMRHVDLNIDFTERRWNLGIQLNENYDGGEYVIYNTDKKESTFSKKTGTVIAYKSHLEHEIKEITEGERWSIVMPISKNLLLEKNRNFI